MTKTTQYQSGVMAVTSLARTINPEIGAYQEHFINESFGFSVRLSNGAINMSVEVAQDYEAQPSSVTQDRIERVAKTFRRI
ncbi:MAG: hypothetical protein HYU71_10440 [Bacteroidetes bacterium]|nr:hypothetical protein [Bacteroidota bacterium]